LVKLPFQLLSIEIRFFFKKSKWNILTPTSYPFNTRHAKVNRPKFTTKFQKEIITTIKHHPSITTGFDTNYETDKGKQQTLPYTTKRKYVLSLPKAEELFFFPRKIMLFLSFQITHEVANQTKDIKEHRALA